MAAPIEPAWLSMTGAITGIIGTVTGIAGAVMGYLAYRHSNEIKALDLRVELQKQENDLRRVAQSLPAHLEHARQSRSAVAAAIGNFQSGATKRWLGEWDTDFATAQLMSKAAPVSVDHSGLSHSELEAKLISVHASLGDALQLRAKYDGTVTDDNQRREELRAAHSSRTPPRIDR